MKKSYCKFILFLVMMAGSVSAQHWSEPELVDSINGVIEDFYPSISADGQTMHFTTGNRIMVTHRLGNAWSAPTMLGDNINSGVRQIKATVTPDNRTLYFASWRAGGYGAYDIWKANWDDSCNCWGTPEVLPLPINTAYMETDVQLTLDGMYMYFTSDRSYGWGFNDIWCTEQDSFSGNWGEPYNLGPLINSSSHDECPYPSPDNSQLYFSSWHPHGFEPPGGLDIFVAYKRNGSWDSLSHFVSPINTGYREYSSAISPDGTELYISSSRPGGPGDADIYVSHLITGIDEDPPELTFNFDLSITAFPNPFNSTTVISYSNIDSHNIEIYDITGRLVKTIHIGHESSGTITWDATDDTGQPVCSGVYFIRAQTANGMQSAKLVYLK